MNDNIPSSADYCVRGDIYYVTRDDKNRPAVIVSNNYQNKYSPYVEIVYLTSQEKKPLPTHVDVMAKCPSVALCENVHTISKDLLGTYIISCTDKEMEEIDKALCDSLAIQMPDISEKSAAEIEALKIELSVVKGMYKELLDKMIGGKNG